MLDGYELFALCLWLPIMMHLTAIVWTLKDILSQLRDVGAPHAAPEAQAVAVTPPKPGPAASFLPAGPGKRGRVE